jgi:ferredoxin
VSLQVPQGVRAAVLRRDGPYCARCGQCTANVPSSVHHRLPRRMGGTLDPRINDPRNLVVLCGTGTTGCHGAVESDRVAAYADGWLIRNLDHLDEPLRTRYGTRITLAGDGTRVDHWPYDDVPLIGAGLD